MHRRQPIKKATPTQKVREASNINGHHGDQNRAKSGDEIKSSYTVRRNVQLVDATLLTPQQKGVIG